MVRWTEPERASRGEQLALRCTGSAGMSRCRDNSGLGQADSSASDTRQVHGIVLASTYMGKLIEFGARDTIFTRSDEGRTRYIAGRFG